MNKNDGQAYRWLRCLLSTWLLRPWPPPPPLMNRLQVLACVCLKGRPAPAKLASLEMEEHESFLDDLLACWSVRPTNLWPCIVVFMPSEFYKLLRHDRTGCLYLAMYSSFFTGLCPWNFLFGLSPVTRIYI